MQKENHPDRAQLLLVCAAIAAGLLLCFGMFARREALRRELREVNAQADTVYAGMMAISDEKEGIQAQLKDTRSAIREAELTLEESTAKAEEISAQLPALRQEKAALEQWAASGAEEADPGALAQRLSAETQTLTVATEALRLNLSRGSAAGVSAGLPTVQAARDRLLLAEQDILPLLLSYARASEAPPAAETLTAWSEEVKGEEAGGRRQE